MQEECREADAGGRDRHRNVPSHLATLQRKHSTDTIRIAAPRRCFTFALRESCHTDRSPATNDPEVFSPPVTRVNIGLSRMPMTCPICHRVTTILAKHLRRRCGKFDTDDQRKATLATARQNLMKIASKRGTINYEDIMSLGSLENWVPFLENRGFLVLNKPTARTPQDAETQTPSTSTEQAPTEESPAPMEQDRERNFQASLRMLQESPTVSAHGVAGSPAPMDPEDFGDRLENDEPIGTNPVTATLLIQSKLLKMCLRRYLPPVRTRDKHLWTCLPVRTQVKHLWISQKKRVTLQQWKMRMKRVPVPWIREHRSVTKDIQTRLSKGISKEVVVKRYKALNTLTMTAAEAQKILDVAKSEFLKCLRKIRAGSKAKEHQLQILNYLECLLVLKHGQRPEVIQHMTVSEWKERVHHQYKGEDFVAIGVKEHKTSTQQVASFVLTPTEEEWFNVYFTHVRPVLSSTDNSEDPFFVSTTGKAIYNVTNDMNRLHRKYNLPLVTSQMVRKLLETWTNSRYTDVQQRLVARYLAHSNITADRSYREKNMDDICHPYKILMEAREESQEPTASTSRAAEQSTSGRIDQTADSELDSDEEYSSAR
ncbi:unnamed protein product [Ranitomeya imitator]|uniref:Uncharacterized protein n=1 Tax=Ranitomeya imitator TaxID=111125 RepID=A0ABN9LWJ3_9NEOB|nr:unnamed protein product [Ranitomeya imitator]